MQEVPRLEAEEPIVVGELSRGDRDSEQSDSGKGNPRHGSERRAEQCEARKPGSEK
jgi:hypothetical protein